MSGYYKICFFKYKLLLNVFYIFCVQSSNLTFPDRSKETLEFLFLKKLYNSHTLLEPISNNTMNR